MLDANDIQIITELLAQQKKELRQELHEDMMTLLESDVYPRIQLLAEGHELLLEKINEMGTTVVVITHEKELVNAFSKRVITIDCGEMTGDSSEGGYYGI